MEELQAAVVEIRHDLHSTQTRLRQGAETFANLSQQMKTMREEMQWPKWKVITISATIVMAVSAFIVQAARMPDPASFHGVESQVQELKTKIAVQEALLQTIASESKTLGGKLDVVIQQQASSKSP